MHSITPTAAVALPALNSRLAQRVCAFGARLAGHTMFRQSLLSIAGQAVVGATKSAITVIFSGLCGNPEVGLYYLAFQVVFFARGAQEQLVASEYLVSGGRRQGKAAAAYAGSTLVHEILLLGMVGLSLAGAAAYGNLSD